MGSAQHPSTETFTCGELLAQINKPSRGCFFFVVLVCWGFFFFFSGDKESGFSSTFSGLSDSILPEPVMGRTKMGSTRLW